MMFQPYPHPRIAWCVYHFWHAIGTCLPLWYKHGGWRERLWYYVTSQAWGWGERAEGRL